MKTNRYLRDLDLCERYGVARASIWRWAANGRFPRPITLTPGCTRWRASDVERWEAEKAGEPVLPA